MIKYLEVYKDLKEKIIKQTYKPWSSLEGEVILSNRYSVSRPTIRKAIDKLKSDGLIHSRQGSGIFVNPKEFYEEQNLKSLSEKFYKNGRLKNRVLIFKKIFSDDKISEIFNVEIDTIFYYFKRVRIIDGNPSVLEETYMPEYLFKNLTIKDVEGSMLSYIEKSCSFIISHDSGEIKGHLLSEEEAIDLNSKEGQLTLSISHKVYLMRSLLAQYTNEIKLDNFFRMASVR